MTRVLPLVLLMLGGCRCLEAVAECHFPHCPSPDGGAHDGGATDAGHDAGTADAGPAGQCSVWDGGGIGQCDAITGYVFTPTQCQGECVTRPIVTPGVYPTLSVCVSCGCDTSKFVVSPFVTQTLAPDLWCDQLLVRTSRPQLLEEAFPGLDAGCEPVGAVDFVCMARPPGQLGDAGYARACASTLIPSVTEVRCQVFIP